MLLGRNFIARRFTIYVDMVLINIDILFHPIVEIVYFTSPLTLGDI